MFVEGNEVSVNRVVKTDICIVGGGAAGITMAQELANTGISVVLLESGYKGVDLKTQALYQGEVSDNYFQLDGVRLRFFGGSTNHWNGYHRPFDAYDFGDRDWIPHSGWPISKNDLEPFYQSSLEILGLTTEEFDAERVSKDNNLELLNLDSSRFFNRISQLRPVRFGSNFNEKLEKAKNVDVILGANCTRLNSNETGNNINSVDVETLEGNKFRVEAKHYVLASGGIENARLLLCSNDVVKNGIGNDRDVVGRYFMEHPDCFAGYLVCSDVKRATSIINSYFGAVRNKLVPSLAIQPDVLKREKLGNFVGNIRPYFPVHSDGVETLKAMTESLGNGQIPTELSSGIKSIIRDFDNTAIASVRKIFNYDSQVKKERLLTLAGTIEQVPNKDSRITLIQDTDALGVQKVRLDWQLSNIDKRTMRQGWKLLGDEFSRLGIGRVWTTLPAETDEWPGILHWSYHHMGTTRMASDPAVGVVDKNCTVHGVNNLHVAGSSVFPTGGSCTPTSTIIALALRLTAHLQQEIKNAA